jgi:HEAT repeat protein
MSHRGLRRTAILLLLLISPVVYAAPEGVLESIERRFGHPEECIRKEAAEDIRDVDPEDALVFIVRLLEDESLGRSVHSAAWTIVEKLGPLAAPILPALLRHARKGHGRPDRSQIEALGRLGPSGAEAVPMLVEILGSRSQEPRPPTEEPGRRDVDSLRREFDWMHQIRRRRAAAASLGWIGARPDLAVPALTAALRDENLDIMRAAVEALGTFGRDAEGAVSDILAAARRVSSDVCEKALGKIATESPRARLRLAAAAALLLRDEPLQDEIGLLVAIGALGRSASEEAVAPLVKALGSPFPAIRREAYRALRRLGSLAKPALPALQRMLDDEIEAVARAARSLIASFRKPAVSPVPDLVAGLEDLPEPELSRRIGQIRSVLRSVKISATDAAAFGRALRDPSRRVRLIAAEAFARAGVFHPVAVDVVVTEMLCDDQDRRARGLRLFEPMHPLLEERLSELEPALRTRVARAEKWRRGVMEARRPRRGLSAVDDTRWIDVDELVCLLRRGKVLDRCHAARFLASRARSAETVETVVPALIEALTDPSRSVRRLSAESLGKIGVNTREVRSALEHAVKDSNERVRQAAREALQRVKGS